MIQNFKNKMKSFPFFKNKKSKKVIIIMLVVLNLAGITLAKYASDFYSNKTMALAENFYFTSDFLSAGGMEHELKNWDTKSDYMFMIDAKNWEDDLRISKMDISYEITVSSGCTYKVNAQTTAGSGTYTIPKDTKQTDKIIVTVPRNVTLTNDTVKVTINAKMMNGKGYAKTMTGTFHLNKKADVFEYTIEKNRNYIDVMIGSDMDNNFTLSYPSCLKPDNTIEELKNAVNGQATFSLNKDKSRMLRFFIMDSMSGSLVIKTDSRTVTIDLATLQEVK